MYLVNDFHKTSCVYTYIYFVFNFAFFLILSTIVIHNTLNLTLNSIIQLNFNKFNNFILQYVSTAFSYLTTFRIILSEDT